MCGIVGYIGASSALPHLLDGLRRLESRGYDSAGIALLEDGLPLRLVRAPGRLAALEARCASLVGLDAARAGIGHTRWATHGAPTEANAHPHADCHGRIAVVHNGIIENHASLRAELETAGHTFRSETDTEVLAHLIETETAAGASLSEAVRRALTRVRGAYGIAVVDASEPNELVAARMSSPIVIGIGEGEAFLASDPAVAAMSGAHVAYLEDGELAIVRADGFRVLAPDRRPVAKKTCRFISEGRDAEKGAYAHFMLKEMHEQPEVITDVLRGRLDPDAGTAVLGGLRDVAERVHHLERLVIVACGSAAYAGQLGEYLLETEARLPVEVELASEFRYRDPILSPTTALLAVSQSGETADTLAAVREGKRLGALTLGMVNVVGSAIARETDAGVYTRAGAEVGVATTKAFLAQLTVFALLTISFGRARGMSAARGRELSNALVAIPEAVRRVLETRGRVRAIAERYADAEHLLFLGRRFNAPVAYEGALKLKEIGYAHAEAYPAGEMKHGPLALVREGFPCVVVCPDDSVRDKTLSNIAELRARGARVLAVATEGDTEIPRLAQDVLFVPRTIEPFTPFVTAVALQLFAYAVAVARGLDPDRPRNLAKSVTVE